MISDKATALLSFLIIDTIINNSSKIGIGSGKNKLKAKNTNWTYQGTQQNIITAIIKINIITIPHIAILINFSYCKIKRAQHSL